jgi:phage baseplate assembly protein gpV
MIRFGTVKSVDDPKKLGRVKVKLYDIHRNIETKDLPWSQVIMPATTPAINGTGHSVNLAVNSLVCGIFLDDTMQEFMVMGSLPTKTEGVEDNNVRVRAEPDPHAAETRGTYQPASTYAPKYPYNNVMETESGHVKEYDDTPGLERITERHKSGTNYEVTADGSKNETIVRDNYRLVVGQETLEVYGDVRVIISGHADVAVAGNLTASVTGNIAADSSGDITLKTNDTTKKINLTGNVDITENLTVAKNVVVAGTTTTSEDLLLDDHKHVENNTPSNLTNGPQNG